MRSRTHILLLLLLSLCPLSGHISSADHATLIALHDSDPSAPASTDTPTTSPKKVTVKPDGVRVSVLGYHIFTEKGAVSDMTIRSAKFRKQMQAIKDLGLNVISLEDFILWKQGKKNIPDHSILITIDDGWKSVYTQAYPILKEFNFPFSIFLYTNYIDIGGRSLSKAQIKEMMANGCSIGSHSVSHPKPSKVKKMKHAGEETYNSYLKREFGTSQKLLKQLFSRPIDTYVYPGGHYDESMYPVSDHYGYKFLFTCRPGKTTRQTEPHTVPRYIILGQDKFDYIFRHATTFKATASSLATAGAIFHTTPHPVSPKPGKKVGERMPTLTADLSAVTDLDPGSLVMRVSGFGKVPAIYDATSKTFSWKINRPLRTLTCSVSVQWKLKEEKKYRPAMKWTFIIDKEAAYIPKTAPAMP